MFDELVARHGMATIKTIGDAYMVVGGIPDTRKDHTEGAAALALDLIKTTEKFNAQYKTSVRIRIGLSAGPVIAGVIGQKRFAYDLWGSTVNMAFHLERLSEAGLVLVGETAYQRLQQKYRFEAVQVTDRKLPVQTRAYKILIDE
jgi:class 3 adenylate cyclase